MRLAQPSELALKKCDCFWSHDVSPHANLLGEPHQPFQRSSV